MPKSSLPSVTATTTSPAHDRALEVGVGVVLIVIMAVLAVGLFRRQLFQPHLIIVMEAAFVVVDEDAGRDVHGVDEHKTLLYAALAQRLLHLRGDIDNPPAAWADENRAPCGRISSAVPPLIFCGPGRATRRARPQAENMLPRSYSTLVQSTAAAGQPGGA